ILRHHVEPQLAPERRLPLAQIFLQYNQRGQWPAAAQPGTIAFAARRRVKMLREHRQRRAVRTKAFRYAAFDNLSIIE
ncbi:hypothetical protein AIZ20_23830, partial [Salmonella enterica subsp. enterica serovar Typhimurium]